MGAEGRERRAETGGDETRLSPADRGRVVVLNRDLFFGVRIGNQLRALGYTVEVVPDAARFVATVRAADPPAVLGVIDIAARPDWTPIQALTADPAFPTPLLAFGPHLDVAGLRAAKVAGAARVVSNGDFHRAMIDLVRRYARSPE
jgi:hypothetical protein